VSRIAVAFRALIISLFLSASVMTSAVFSEQRGTENILVKIGDNVITKEDIEWRIQGLPEEQQRRFKNDSGKKELLEMLVQNRLFAMEAKAEKMDQQKGLAIGIEDVVNYYMAKSYIKYKITEKIKVSEADIKKYYAEHKEDFKTPPTVKIQHILIKAVPDAIYKDEVTALKKAKRIKKELDEGADFAKMAQQYSDDAETKKSGGVLDYIRVENINPDVGAVVNLMKVGQISKPVRNVMGYNIVKLLDKKPAKHLTQEEAAPQIRSLLSGMRQKEMVEQELERLKKKYDVTGL